MWSFAVLLWEILTFAREQPFEYLGDDKLLENLAHYYQNDGKQVSIVERNRIEYNNVILGVSQYTAQLPQGDLRSDAGVLEPKRVGSSELSRDPPVFAAQKSGLQTDGALTKIRGETVSCL